jgi:transposase-like protein
MRGISNGHRRHSAAEWRNIIERYRQSGLGITEFCAQEGVTVGTFELWYRRHRRTAPRPGQFVEVQPLAALGGPWAVEVELPSGVRLRLRG